MLGEKLRSNEANVWLINTGWTGGPFGTGKRIKLAYTRAMVTAALEGKLDEIDFDKLAIFNLQIPVSCPDVPAELLNPRNTWKDKEQFDGQIIKLANLFNKNFEKYTAGVSAEILSAAPKI
jgi:phosphoenolpyruvate carboxykinase (ATP)